MHPVLSIAAKDLRLRVRDRSAWLTGLVAPLALAAIISTALGGIGQSPRVHLAVVDGDRGPRASLFVETLRSPSLRKLVTVRPAPSTAAAEDLVRTGSVNAAIVIPPGFSGPSPPTPALRVLDRPDQLLGKGIARAVADGFMAHLAGTRLAVATAAALTPGHPDPGRLDSVAGQAAAAEAADALVDQTPGRRVAPAAYYAPAMAILFLFFLAGFGARSFLAERRDNTMARLLAAPVRPRHVVAGKALATFVIGLTSLLVMYGASDAVFHASWGNPLGVVVLCVVLVAAVMAVTALATTFARTDDQANGYTGMLTFVLALVGGNFIAIDQLPPLLRTASAFTPNGWALRGFSDMAAGTGTVTALVVPLLAVGGFAVVCGALALRRAPRLVAA